MDNTNYLYTLYFVNEFIPKYISNCRDIFFTINSNKFLIQNWNDILTKFDMRNYKEFDFYTRYLINRNIDIQNLLSNHFKKEVEDFYLNCLDKTYLYQQCKKLLIHINDILLFFEFNQMFYQTIYILDIELNNLNNITDHLLYLFEVSFYLTNLLNNHLYEYYLFHLQSDMIGNEMFQYPIFNIYNIQSRNELVKEPLSNDFLYNLLNKQLKKSSLFVNYKNNSRNLLRVLNQCIDYMYSNENELPNHLQYELIITYPKLNVTNAQQQMVTRTNSTPIKKEETQSLINRLSTPRLNKMKSPYQRMIELNIENIFINRNPEQKKTSQKKIVYTDVENQ